MTFAEIRSFWDNFWFRPTSPAAVCVFRILFGLMALAAGLTFAADFFTFFGMNGMVSTYTVQAWHGSPRLSLLLWLPYDKVAFGVFCAYMVSAVCVMLGLYTKPSLAVLFLSMVSLHHRNPFILNSSDTLLRLFCFQLMFAPCAKMYSLDAYFRKRPYTAQQLLSSPWAQRLIQLQIMAVYCQTFWGKLMGDNWLDGTAVYYALSLFDYQRLPVPLVLDHVWTVKLLTWGALAIEFALWALIWIKELRYPILIAGVMLHLGIEWSMNIPVFEILMICSFINFVDSALIENALSRLRDRLMGFALRLRPAS